MTKPSYRSADFDHSPMLVFYEVTRACDLQCKHCRAEAQTHRHPEELAHDQSKSLITHLTAFPRPPLLVFTGGDPIKRPDIFDLVAHAVDAGLEVAMTPSATPLVTPDVVHRLQSAGLHRLAVSLDGVDAATHDAFRRVPGSYDRTLQIIADAHAAGLPVQINTTITRHNVHQLDAIADFLATQGIVLWSVFFLIPVGRASADQRLTPEENEAVFARLYEHSRRQPYAIKTTEAPHYRRFLLQQRKAAHLAAAASQEASADRPSLVAFAGTNDGRGVLFVSHTGEIYPSGFLPILAGRFPADSVVTVYQNSAIFRALRNADQLSGKCSDCEYRHLCGGSRARAYALTRDPLAADPDCAYLPKPRLNFPSPQRSLGSPQHAEI